MTEAVTPGVGPGLKGEVVVLEPSRFERVIARRSAESRATIPTMEFGTIVDGDALIEREAGIGCGVAALVVEAAAKSLRAVPRVNGSYRDGRYELYSRINIGTTIMEQGIYVTPTVFDADTKSPAEISQELAALFARAREEELLSSELTGATFTVVDSSVYDIVAVAPMINPPQAAALAFGPIRDVPVVRDGQVVAGRTMQLALAVDHRIAYGDHAASFLEGVKASLEESRA
jgi:pyruvate dehydrogenase E2 component (dihydrolipoamide acetyltransferase)